MTLEEKLEMIASSMRDAKVAMVENSPSDPDLLIHVHFFRGDFIPMIAQCQGDRDKGLETVWVGATGFSATEVAITCEAYHSTTPVSPITGEAWEHHELQFVAETMPDSGTVWECLTTLIVDRTTRVLTNMSCYRIVDGAVEWTQEELLGDTETDKQSGAMVDTLREAMRRPKLLDVLPLKNDPVAQMMLGQLSEVAAEFHSDMATWRTLVDKDLVVSAMLGAEPGTERYDMLKNALGNPDLRPDA